MSNARLLFDSLTAGDGHGQESKNKVDGPRISSGSLSTGLPVARDVRGKTVRPRRGNHGNSDRRSRRDADDNRRGDVADDDDNRQAANGGLSRLIDGCPEPFYGDPIPLRLYPKKHQPGDLKVGDSVWYRGERYWIEQISTDWEKSCGARISSVPVDPVPGRLPSNHRVSLCVHVDMLDLAPTVKTRYHKQPTLAATERKERIKHGMRDVGDPVAVMLRDCQSLDDVFAKASEYLAVPEPELRAKYGHLNPGQQRMNLGNKMRFKWKKGADF